MDDVNLTEFALSRVREARRIVNARGSMRAGLPDAWASALMHLKRDIHVPAGAREDFAFLSNEIGRAFEANPSGGLRFMDGITDDDVQRAGTAFWNLYDAICHLHQQRRASTVHILNGARVPHLEIRE